MTNITDTFTRDTSAGVPSFYKIDTTSSSVAMSPPPATTIKTIIGVASNDLAGDITAAEAAIGKQFGGRRQNAAMSGVVPNSTDIGFRNAGLWCYRNANNETASPASPLFGGWAGVAAGNADSYLASCVPAIVAHYTPSFPLLWSLHHEQNVANAQQCGITCNGTASDYVAFFRYIVRYMRTAGIADRIKFCCVPNIKQYRVNDTTDGIQVVDPGASYVDIYGCDIYTMDVDNATTSGLNLVGQYALDRGKLAMIGEFGIHVNTALGAANLQSALDLFVSQGNWIAVMTDTATMGSLLMPKWQAAAADTTHFAFKGEVTSWPVAGPHTAVWDDSRVMWDDPNVTWDGEGTGSFPIPAFNATAFQVNAFQAEEAIQSFVDQELPAFTQSGHTLSAKIALVEQTAPSITQELSVANFRGLRITQTMPGFFTVGNPTGFQDDTFQLDAFETGQVSNSQAVSDTLTVRARLSRRGGDFQQDAFQNDAFEAVVDTPIPIPFPRQRGHIANVTHGTQFGAVQQRLPSANQAADATAESGIAVQQQLPFPQQSLTGFETPAAAIAQTIPSFAQFAVAGILLPATGPLQQVMPMFVQSARIEVVRWDEWDVSSGSEWLVTTDDEWLVRR